MNVLVTGGTGFVGRHVLREIHRAGHELFFLSRRGHSAACYAIEDEFSGQIRSGDILDPKTLLDACAGMDAIIHLVGIISEVGKQTFENVHTRGTENLIRAAQHTGVKRFIHMSALGTRPNAIARYHQSKWKAEEIVRTSGLDWTIFRPSIIYGPGDGFVNLFAKIARRSPFVPVVGSGNSKLQPISVENVANAFGKSLVEPRAIGQTFVLAGPEVFTFDQIIDQILQTMNLKRTKLHLPLPLARAQAALLEFVFAKLLHNAPPLNRDQIQMLQEDNVGNGGAADEFFNLQHEQFEARIRRYLND